MTELSPEKAIENFKKLVEDFDCKVSQIFLAHPSDLLEMDMNEYPTNCYFISQSFVEKGTVLSVGDEALKKELYKCAKDNPDKVYQGENRELFYKAFEKIRKERGGE